MGYMENYKKWCEDTYFDEATRAELKAIEGNDKEIQERFYKDLEFGTGGLRGIIGAGTNRLNIYTVSKATQGFANYIIKQGEEAVKKGVAIAFDSRRMSPEFAEITALVLNGNGIKTYIYPSLRPTPMLSFAVRELNCTGGVVITASHNPPEYNGYKVYWADGGQVPYPRDEAIIEEVNAVTDFHTIKTANKDEAVKAGLFNVIGEEVDEAFLPILYELDERSEWLDPKMWIKANPGLGKLKQVETLRSFVERAKKNPADRAGVLCKDFNVRENDSTAWLPFDVINNEATFDLADVYDTYAIGGCDLSSTTDLTCATLLIRKPNDKTVYVLQHYFLPQARIDELADKKQRSGGHSNDEAPYKLWAERGLLTACQGARVNYSDVTAWFVQMRERYKIDCWKCGYDRALAGYWVDEMTANGFTMDKVIQGTYTFSQPMRELGAALQDKLVNYNNNPVLKWCLSNTGKKEQGLNNIMPVKISEKRRIDGMVSLLNAWVVYVRDYEDYMYNVG